LIACWWVSEFLMALGMMGTLIGFIIVLAAIAGLAITSGGAAAGIFGTLGGVGTAISVTLSGLITSQLIKLQLVNIQISMDEE
jgi:flagellar motor component MotA